MNYRLGVRATLVLLVLVFVIPILGLVVQTSISEQQSALEKARILLRLQAQLRADNQERLFEGVRHMLKVISSSRRLLNPVAEECSEYFRELKSFFPRYANLSFADAQGNMVCRSTSAEGPIYIGDREHFKDAIRTRNFTVSGYLVSRVTGKPSIVLNLPVYRGGGELHGVLYAVRELEFIQAQLGALAAPPGTTELITDAEGIVLVSVGEQPQRAGERVSSSFLSKAVLAGRPALDQAVDENGREWLYAIQPVHAEGAGSLVVASVVARDSILGPAIQRLQKELAILLGITLAATLIAWKLGDLVLAAPIQRILAKVKALERGGTATEQLALNTGPQVHELRQIDRGIDDLAEALETRSLQRDRAMAEISEQKLAMEASERRYRAQFESSPQPMWVFDTETLAFLVVNDAAVMHYGYSRGEFFRMTLADVRPPEDIPLLMETLRVHKADALHEILRRHRRKNGEIIDVEISSHALNWDGRAARMMIVYDVTSRELAKAAWKGLHDTLERKVAQRTRELEIANEELEAFSYSVSHDLRAPVQVIDGFCGALAEKYRDDLPAQAKHYLDRVRAGARQMNGLIEDLLSLARTGRVSLELQLVDLAPTVRNAVARLRQRFPDRVVNVEIEESLPAACDPRLIAVLLDNLIGNAWKFTARTAHPTIRVGVRADTPNGPAYFVSDDGAGFDMAFADKLFKPFQRLHSAAEFEGTGIGLAIVYRIVRRHGGRVWAEAEVDKGASFFFSLPQAAA
ncbi:MAG TPA: ATP-binding protein [Ramlibacter sp.]|nr:ATP-binding protein [Ramlibacter sp.]